MFGFLIGIETSTCYPLKFWAKTIFGNKFRKIAITAVYTVKLNTWFSQSSKQ